MKDLLDATNAARAHAYAPYSGPAGVRETVTLGELLPRSFGPEQFR
jgi:hypothetical protein